MSDFNEQMQSVFRQLKASQEERRGRQREIRASLGYAGDQWDSLAKTWLNLRHERLHTLWEYAAVASRIADGFGDDALEHFATQVETPSGMMRRAVEGYRQTFIQAPPALGKLFTSEAEYASDLQGRLIARGFTVKREASTSFGRVDLLAGIYSGGGKVSIQLIEAKLSADWRAAAQALGQLVFYRGSATGTTDIPDWQMWFACPDRPDEDVLKVLERHGIGYIG